MSAVLIGSATMTPASVSVPPLGRELKRWRRIRGMSQLDLASRAEVSARHIAFVETGRTQPTRGMLLRLAGALQVPLREQNHLLQLGGLAPAFPEREWSAPDLSAMRRIVERLLDSHDPYPGFALNRWWDIVMVNRAARQIFAPLLGDGPGNAIELFLGSPAFRQVVENWAEVAWVTLGRLRHEVALSGGDERLSKLLESAERYLEQTPPPSTELNNSSPMLASRLRLGDCTVSTVSTLVSFSAARDITLDELRVELVFPADAASEQFFREQLPA